MAHEDLSGLSKEQRILRVMRKVLANIVKDVTPRPGEPNPLQDETIADIRDLFGLIAERERELADAAGRTADEKPRYADEPRQASVVKLTRPAKKPETKH